MNCICDDFSFPPETLIVPGLTDMPRQIGTFAEFRRAMLRAISVRDASLLQTQPLWSLRFLIERDRPGLRKSLEAIGNWRGRHPEDFGMMLLEMWAYVCDLTSFYDEVIAHEQYVRTARRRDSLRKLVDPLGYIPRPGVSALADLAAFADGRKVVSLPIGTAFRSGAFSGNPPQVFELDAETKIHPFLNQWTLLPVRPATFGPSATDRQTFLVESDTLAVAQEDLVLVKVGGTAFARTVTKVAPKEGADHLTYSEVTLSSSVPVPANTPVTSVKLRKPAAKASLWTQTDGGYAGVISGISPFLAIATAYRLDSISTAFRVGQDVIVDKAGVLIACVVMEVDVVEVTIKAATTSDITDGTNLIARVPVPPVVAKTTRVVAFPSITGDLLVGKIVDAAAVSLHHTFVSAGRVTVEALTEIDRTDPLNVKTPLELPRDSSPPGEFQLEDVNGSGLTRPGSLNFATGHFTVNGDPWPDQLATPVKLFGNLVATSRGETVKGEVLGTGNGAIANQSFTLKKKPLTYLPSPSESTSSGLTSTLKVYVDGLQWTEAPSFYGRPSTDQVYIVRQNDKEESVVTFGDGILGRRLSTGSVVVGYYRFGSGGVMPPAGSITQIAKPVKGLKSVRSPVAPFGGADSEAGASLQKYAPRSALLLGRAVSLADLEAAAASYAGVRAVAAEWRWSSTLQVPAAHIWYLADGDLTELILIKLRSLTQPDTPIQVERATAYTKTLSIQIDHDPKRFEAEVVLAARTAMLDVETGLLPPERLGIGKPLFRSRIFEFLLNVPGVQAVTGLRFSYDPFTNFGILPPAGHYFDFTNNLDINGGME
jgi:hypothetical protein